MGAIDFLHFAYIQFVSSSSGICNSCTVKSYLKHTETCLLTFCRNAALYLSPPLECSRNNFLPLVWYSHQDSWIRDLQFTLLASQAPPHSSTLTPSSWEGVGRKSWACPTSTTPPSRSVPTGGASWSALCPQVSLPGSLPLLWGLRGARGIPDRPWQPHT